MDLTDKIRELTELIEFKEEKLETVSDQHKDALLTEVINDQKELIRLVERYGNELDLATETAKCEYGLFSGPNIFKCSITKEPIIDRVLYRKDVAAFVAKRKTGKSIMALQLIANLTNGTNLFQTFDVAKKHNVLYLQTEGDRSETCERYESMNKGILFDTSRLVHKNVPGISLDDRGEYEKFAKSVNSLGRKFDVIIVDSLYMSLGGRLSDEEATKQWISNMREFKAQHDAALILMHHPTKDSFSQMGKEIDKGDDMFGSSFWGNFVNQIFKLTYHKKESRYTLSCNTERSNKILDEIDLKMNDEPLMFVHGDDDFSSATHMVEGFLRGNKGAYEPRKLCNKHGKRGLISVSTAQFYRSIEILINNGVVKKFKRGPKTFYQWKEYYEEDNR